MQDIELRDLRFDFGSGPPFEYVASSTDETVGTKRTGTDGRLSIGWQTLTCRTRPTVEVDLDGTVLNIRVDTGPNVTPDPDGGCDSIGQFFEVSGSIDDSIVIDEVDTEFVNEQEG